MSETIEKFKHSTEERFRETYIQTLNSNLAELYKQEAKAFILICITVLMYMLVQMKSINGIDLGFFKIEKTEILVAYLPIVFIYSLFHSYSVTFQIKETRKILEELLQKELLFEPDRQLKLMSTRFSRAFFPYSISTTLAKLAQKPPHIIMSIIGFIILLPTIVIGLLPYIILTFMLIQTYSLGLNSYLIWIGFCASIWGTLLLLFMVIMNGLKG